MEVYYHFEITKENGSNSEVMHYDLKKTIALSSEPNVSSVYIRMSQ